MALAWKQVEAKPEFQDLSPQQKQEAQEEYFNTVVAPQAGTNANEARSEFFKEFNYNTPTPAQGIPLGAGSQNTLPKAGQPQQQQQPQKSLSDMSPIELALHGGAESVKSLIGAAETGTQMLTGALSGGAAGFNSIYDAIKGENEDQVRKDIESIERDYTYQPKTEAGRRYSQNIANVINTVMSPIQKGFDVAGEKTLEATKSPILATAVQSFPDIASTLAPVVGGIKGAVRGEMAARAAMKADRSAVRDLDFDNLEARLATDNSEVRPTMEANNEDIKKQIERKQLFNQEGIPATRGDITQNFDQQAQEARMMESSSDPSADKFRNYILKRSDALKDNLENLAKKSGISDEAGSAIKEALTERKKMLRTQKNALYKDALESARSGGVKDIPILTDDIRAAIPDEETMGDLAVISGASTDNLGKLLERYGVIGEDAATPLSVGNMERFRTSLNAIAKTDDSGAVNVAIGPIKTALDEEMNNIGGTLDKLGLTDKNVVKPLEQARKTVRQINTEFNAKSMAGKLVNDKKNSNGVPVVENSQVYNKLMSKSTPVEHVQQISSILSKSKDGKKALGNMQAAVIMDALDAALEAKTRKIDGQSAFSSVAFEKRLEQMGDKKLSAIFNGNLKSLAQLRRVKKIAGYITPPSGAVQKGSGNVILDMLGKTGIKAISTKVPGLDVAIEGLERLAASSKSRTELDKAMNTSPEVKKLADYISETHPALSAALGIPVGALTVARREREQKQD